MRNPVLVAAAVPLALTVSAESNPSLSHHWSYEGVAGPNHWGGVCHTGGVQSPIDIKSATAKHKGLQPLAFSYRPGPLKIIDNGHSVQVDVASGSMLSLGGIRLPLLQFHFHHPSEEAIDGKHSDMVVHLVHGDGHGNLAVVAVLLRQGAANPAIDTLWKHLPRKKEVEQAPAGVTIDPSALLPAKRDYFTFMGSLTTPPCTEHVRWFVLKTPVSVSAEQIARFEKLYPHNARPIQPVNGREIYTSG